MFRSYQKDFYHINKIDSGLLLDRNAQLKDITQYPLRVAPTGQSFVLHSFFTNR